VWREHLRVQKCAFLRLTCMQFSESCWSAAAMNPTVECRPLSGARPDNRPRAFIIAPSRFLALLTHLGAHPQPSNIRRHPLIFFPPTSSTSFHKTCVLHQKPPPPMAPAILMVPTATPTTTASQASSPRTTLTLRTRARTNPWATSCPMSAASRLSVSQRAFGRRCALSSQKKAMVAAGKETR